MPQKHTIEFILDRFKKENYILLTKKYINAHQKLKYICPKGHKGTIIWNSWQQGHRCSKCFYENNKHTIEFVREQFEKEGYTLLTTKYIHCKQKLEYICPEGHMGLIRWNSWQQGHRCSECYGNKTLIIGSIREQFEKEGYTLLTTKYIHCKQKLEYICPEGHMGLIRWNSWQQGHRCSKCFYKNNKGENHHNWNSNLMPEERQRERNYPEYRQWRDSVFERDSFTCQFCGKKGGTLNAHHLESFSNNPDLRTVLDNGVCFCEKCHNNFHKQYGKENNTKKQFEEFQAKTRK